jgi:hypothetical protein
MYMKKYLFGLGAMIVGAGLMFALTHGEVSAESATDLNCEIYEVSGSTILQYCKINDLTCVFSGRGISCVKS